jgi:hypothetical protein
MVLICYTCRISKSWFVNFELFTLEIIYFKFLLRVVAKLVNTHRQKASQECASVPIVLMRYEIQCNATWCVRVSIHHHRFCLGAACGGTRRNPSTSIGRDVSKRVWSCSRTVRMAWISRSTLVSMPKES